MSKNNMKDFNFEKIFQQILSEWPSEINLTKVVENLDRKSYSVPALDISDDLEKKYFNTPKEILYRHMYSAIYIVLHKLAAHYTNFKLNNLDPHDIRYWFEKQLIETRKNLSWTKEDQELVDQYFLANSEDLK